jgi:chromate reductase
MSARIQAKTPATASLRVLGLAGSLRRDSYNRRLLTAASSQAPVGMTVTLFDDLASVPLYSGDLDGATDGGPAPVARLRRAVRACDGLLISTPEYNQSVPGVLKNAIDWLSLRGPDLVLEGKPVAIMGATPGAWGTRLAQRTLRQILFSTESLVLTGPAIYLRNVDKLIDASGSLSDAKTLERLSGFLAAFAAWIERLSGAAGR